MGFYANSDKTWVTIRDRYIEVCDWLGLKPGFDKRDNINEHCKIMAPPTAGAHVKDGFIPIDAPLDMIAMLVKKLREKEDEVAALVKRLDDLSGWLASKELQQHLDARLKDLEEKFENEKKKVDKPKRMR